METCKRSFNQPVAWMFGPQLIGALKGVIVDKLYKGFDVRDWMIPNTIPLASKADPNKPFWFDYLADTGDGQLPTYAVAYMCSAPLVIESDTNKTVRVFDSKTPPAPDAEVLPLGAFLFVGGDTAYHVADAVTLATRFQSPFEWAYQDLKERGAIDNRATRPLVGIPGNHDYYDMLDGFNRQFRSPLRKRFSTTTSDEILAVSGLDRIQEASYFAAALPHGWWLYALDTEDDKLDLRQKAYFAALGPPQKLILATPCPTTVFDKAPDPGSKIATTLDAIKVGLPAAKPDPRAAVPRGSCRIDLSGDVHHYARYWGQPEEGENARYASVVSGLGGAFHHPSSTTHGDLAAVKYPTVETSKARIAGRLFNPTVIPRGGYIGSIGALIAALLVGAALGRGTTQWLFERMIALLTPLDCGRAELPLDQTLSSLKVFGAWLFFAAGIVVAIRRAKQTFAENRDAGKRSYFCSWAIAFLSIAAFSFVMWAERRTPAGQVAFDVVFYFFTIALSLGFILGLAIKAGAKERSTRVKVGFAGLGLIHLVFQMLPIPLLIKIGAPAAYVCFLVIHLLGLVFGWLVVRKTSRLAPWLALVAWIAVGAGSILAPLVFHRAAVPQLEVVDIVGYLAIAMVIGYFHCCTHFAWYLAVSFGFNGHNNEVGGAARIESYSQFIRFKVEENAITAYVIGIESKRVKGGDTEMHPRLIDRFTLTT